MRKSDEKSVWADARYPGRGVDAAAEARGSGVTVVAGVGGALAMIDQPLGASPTDQVPHLGYGGHVAVDEVDEEFAAACSIAERGRGRRVRLVIHVVLVYGVHSAVPIEVRTIVIGLEIKFVFFRRRDHHHRIGLHIFSLHKMNTRT
ncbi:MAG: hypothetical protein GWN84_21605 [Gammaproteobacteria bacterium]|nr:hypothetical protein [Gammaproteobacteria bacterium]NIR85318.1 hypothetical protein [Gammaproteobacteria bacterium]NIR88434.1 hypothetical protein [Gammaproteobacteria bacterium]NIU06384.1 hypothetical protein [Gammaproteobacteria bacterium]NIV53283.1 hypothetical protein [Gammaproteobacteria bacterium]